MVSYSIYLVLSLISGYDFTVDHIINTFTKSDFPIIDLAERGFQIGFALFDDKGEIFDDETYFTFKMFVQERNKTDKIPSISVYPVIR